VQRRADHQCAEETSDLGNRRDGYARIVAMIGDRGGLLEQRRRDEAEARALAELAERLAGRQSRWNEPEA